MIRRPVHMISSLTQMTMDAHLYRNFTQSKLHVRAADKPVVLPNSKGQCPFTVTPQAIKIFLSSSPLLSLFFSFTHFRTILPFFPSSAPSVCLYFIFYFPSLFFLVPLFISLLTTPYSFFLLRLFFYCFACILFFLSYYFFMPLCICARLNSTSPVCGMWKS